MGDTCTGPVHAYPTAGLHTITVKVTDAGGFTGWDVYEQQAFAFSGFFAPIRATKPWYRAPGGSTVPVGFDLGGEFGLNVLMPGYPKVGRCGAASPNLAAGEFKFTLGHYSFLWQTRAAWAGTCRQVVFHFVDGSTAVAKVIFTG